MAPGAGGRDGDVFRVVRIRGTRVHYRTSIPKILDHANVVRHFRDGEILVADEIGVGIAHTGDGVGAWFHIRDEQTGTCGWVSSEFVTLLTESYANSRATSASAPVTHSEPAHANPPLPAPKAPSVFPQPTIFTEPRARYGADIDFLADAATVLLFLLTILASRRLAALLAGTVQMVPLLARAGPTGATTPNTDTNSTQKTPAAPSATPYKPHFNYGRTSGLAWHLPSRKP
jgi:hypothetical protein